MKKLYFAVLSVFLISGGCDTQKYLGYNYEAENYVEIASFYGRVSNSFTGEYVPFATIRIEEQGARADERGNYRFNYRLSNDARLGKEVELVISAPNYFPHLEKKSVFPGTFELNVSLGYAAPIIESTGCYDMTFCQAIVFDYQGVEDIDTVSAHFQYIGANNTVTYEFDAGLKRLRTVSPNRAHYQAAVEPVSPQYGTLNRWYTVTARDKSGYSHSLQHKNDEKNPDPLLFPIDSLSATH